MYNASTAELVVTADGDIKTFVWVEELIAAAPKLANWKFTALKPATGSGRRQHFGLRLKKSLNGWSETGGR